MLAGSLFRRFAPYITARSAAHIIKGGYPPLYLITRGFAAWRYPPQWPDFII